MSLASIGSLVGGALILAAFIALQLGRVDAEDRRYQVLNLSGAIVLVAAALMAQLWGFVVLNVVWAVASAWSLVRAAPRAPDAQRSANAQPLK